MLPSTLTTIEVGGFSVGYLLSEVGRAPTDKSRNDRLAILRSLQALHAAGFCHLDSRIYNLLQVGDVLKWIDLGAWTDASASLIKTDIVTLLTSLNQRIDKDLEESIERYAANPTVALIVALM